jgi:hypothetical protein
MTAAAFDTSLRVGSERAGKIVRAPALKAV